MNLLKRSVAALPLFMLTISAALAQTTNRPPTVQLGVVDPAFPVTGQMVSVPFIGIDQDGDMLTIDAVVTGPTPADGSSYRPTNGMVSFVPFSPGSYAISVTVSDGKATANARTQVTVTPSVTTMWSRLQSVETTAKLAAEANATLSAKMTTLETSNQVLLQKLATADAERIVLQAKVATLETANTSLTTKVAALETSNAKLVAKDTELAQADTGLETRLIALVDAANRNTATRLTAAQTDIDGLKTGLGTLQAWQPTVDTRLVENAATTAAAKAGIQKVAERLKGIADGLLADPFISGTSPL